MSHTQLIFLVLEASGEHRFASPGYLWPVVSNLGIIWPVSCAPFGCLAKTWWKPPLVVIISSSWNCFRRVRVGKFHLSRKKINAVWEPFLAQCGSFTLHCGTPSHYGVGLLGIWSLTFSWNTLCKELINFWCKSRRSAVPVQKLDDITVTHILKCTEMVS